jgi:mevalonate kinase
MAWQAEPAKYEALFDGCGEIAERARVFIESGQPEKLGTLMNENQALLREINVSSPELEQLIEAALAGGAMGAKLSGGGRGGNMIALVDASSEGMVGDALLKAGAKSVIATTVESATD